MEAALYDPALGYYNTVRRKIGPRGDYNTSSNVHPVFGEVLAAVLGGLLVEAAPVQTGTVRLVEFGAGTGQLARDVLEALRSERPSLFERLDYQIIETSEAMIALQKEQLAGFEGRVGWSGLSALARVSGVVFSNELVDAFPCHRVRWTSAGVQEEFVCCSGKGPGGPALARHWGTPSTVRLAEYVQRLKQDVLLAEGQVLEINLDAIEWLARVSRALDSGFLVTIDYGDLVGALWAEDRFDGTLRGFARHSLVESLLERPGEQDITASVNFSALIEYGKEFGFEYVSYETERAFMVRNGLVERLMKIEGLKERLAAKSFLVPGGAADNFRVLIQRRTPLNVVTP